MTRRAIDDDKRERLIAMLIDGFNDYEIARTVGVGRTTVKDYRNLVNSGAKEGYCDPLPVIRPGRPQKNKQTGGAA